MCDQRRKDTNRVFIEGTMCGKLSYYEAKGKPRVEFLVRSEYLGRVTKVRAQFRGQKAHDALMLYRENRGIDLEGRLRYRRGGHYVVVVHDFSVGTKIRYSAESVAAALLEKTLAVGAWLDLKADRAKDAEGGAGWRESDPEFDPPAALEPVEDPPEYDAAKPETVEERDERLQTKMGFADDNTGMASHEESDLQES